MSILDLARQRCSMRKYTEQMVEEEKLDKILEMAHVAPTAANMQPVRLVVVKSKDGMEKLGKCARVYGAPVAVVVCANKNLAWKRPCDGMVTTDIDASILTDHMMLMAEELGLGSLWICWFDPEAVKEELDIPEELEPINILALGYKAAPKADVARHAKMRIPMEELVLYK